MEGGLGELDVIRRTSPQVMSKREHSPVVELNDGIAVEVRSWMLSLEGKGSSCTHRKF
jgi:hypothetical protein